MTFPHYHITDDLSDLKKFKMIYLASPYTKYPFGLDDAAEDIAKVTGRLMMMGLNVHSPIVPTHYIAKFAGIDPVDHELWMKIDAAFIEVCDAMVIAQLTGWDVSRGVAHEIDVFTLQNKPIMTLDVGTIR